MTNESEHKYFHRLFCLIIVFVGLVVYSNTIHSSFHFDDYDSIVNNPAIRSLSSVPQLLSSTRGVVLTSFALNYYFSGLSVEGYHWTNISLHLLNGILVYLFATIILNQHPLNTRDGKTSTTPVLAMFIALLFVTSPVQTHTVNYIVERNGELASTFYLLSFMFFTKAVSTSRVSMLPYAGSVIFFVISMYCKEIAYTAFIMMFLYYVCFVSGDWRGWFRGLPLVFPYAFLTVMHIRKLIPTATMQPLGVQSSGGGDTIVNNMVHPWQYLLTQAVVAIEYLKLLVWPLPGRLNVDYDVTLVDNVWELPTAVPTIIFIGLLCIALTLLLLNRLRLPVFLVLWFLVVLLPNSSFFPGGINELMVCYRLYLPSLAFYMLLVIGVHKLFCYLGKKKGIELNRLRLGELAVLTGIVLFYSICAYEHNKVWKTEVSLWEDAVKKSPNKLRPHYNLGKAYELDGMLDEAEAGYAGCIEMFGKAPHSGRNLGIESYYRASLALAAIYSNKGKHTEAIELYKGSLKICPRDAEGRNNLGLAYYRAGYLGEAEREFRLAIELNPKLSVAHENLGALYEIKGESNAALAAFTEAVTVDPQNGKAHIRLGQLWWNFKNRPDMALMHLNEALKLNLNEEVSKKVLIATDIIKKQASHMIRPPIEKAP
ncbi:MAG: hypothetical protein A3C38_04795 [Planctomycetes bacterium RIFCSPHIGHO2_02_FULL_50_42]|nr:MAG: hypothetical protein A3C38_04795 [Planctomycetes bacterium RIFCSPHIGHO2_02_FULL_50_42]OHB94791.1 MAG: hypothetical protein A3I59_02525 [Planctomycetes bacterium RIFCSPLOWO2_02_FULL_50_16]OHC03453.1 MAG: hypothetical protein A3G17_05985 [Planctomycetes bacterium RIFCSPLOWO2_12_FULL_50_35]